MIQFIQNMQNYQSYRDKTYISLLMAEGREWCGGARGKRKVTASGYRFLLGEMNIL